MLNKLSISLMFILLFTIVYAQEKVIYFTENAKKQDISIVTESAYIYNNLLKFRLSVYNNGKDTVFFIKPDTSFINISTLMIFMFEKETGKRHDISLTNLIDQPAGISIKSPLKQIVMLSQGEGFYQDFSVPFNAKKDKTYMIQIVIDYDYTITSPIPLTNLVQQVLESNILDVTYK